MELTAGVTTCTVEEFGAVELRKTAVPLVR